MLSYFFRISPWLNFRLKMVVYIVITFKAQYGAKKALLWKKILPVIFHT